MVNSNKGIAFIDYDRDHHSEVLGKTKGDVGTVRVGIPVGNQVTDHIFGTDLLATSVKMGIGVFLEVPDPTVGEGIIEDVFIVANFQV